MPQLHSKFISLSQLTLHYLESGPITQQQDLQGHQKTMVFLHGFPEYSGAWTKQLHYFAESCRVIAPDLPGYNLSAKPTDSEFYQIGNLISVLAEFMAKINDSNPIYLVAHDWGGALAWPLCAFYPNLVEKLIILNAAHPSTFTREVLNNPRQQQKSAYIADLISADGDALLKKNDFQYLKKMIAHDSNAYPFSASQLSLHRESWAQPGAIACMLKYYQNMPLHQGPGKATHIPNIQIKRPTLVLWGMNDDAFCPELLDGLEDYVADLTVVKFEHASHWLHHEIPNEVNRHIQEAIGLN